MWRTTTAGHLSRSSFSFHADGAARAQDVSRSPSRRNKNKCGPVGWVRLKGFERIWKVLSTNTILSQDSWLHERPSLIHPEAWGSTSICFGTIYLDVTCLFQTRLDKGTVIYKWADVAKSPGQGFSNLAIFSLKTNLANPVLLAELLSYI